jgi:hypothetical protein
MKMMFGLAGAAALAATAIRTAKKARSRFMVARKRESARGVSGK